MSYQSLKDRLQRAESWINAASKLNSKHRHEKFIFFYIAFNCMYGRRQYEGDETKFHQDLRQFLDKVRTMHEKDMEEGGTILHDAIAGCRDSGLQLIKDQFLDNRYWKGVVPLAKLKYHLHQLALEEESKVRIGQFDSFLYTALSSIGVLRNQILHGSATHGPTSRGNPSLAAGIGFLQVIIPAYYELMDKHGNQVKWDPIPYPRWGSDQHPWK